MEDDENDVTSMMRAGRILFEDEKYLTLEVGKDQNTPLRVQDGDRFFTLLFIADNGEGMAVPVIPWENDQ